jgi:hypothetical protein
MTAHDQLLQQLRESVAERRAAAPAAKPRRRFARGTLVLAATLVVGGGVAAAAQVGVLPGTHHASTTISSRQAAFNAVTEAGKTHACRPLTARTVTEPVSPVAAPLLTGATDPVAERLALKDLRTGPYVAGSARRVVLPGGIAVLLWVTVGQGSGAYADPTACGAQRVEQLHRDDPDPGSRLRQKAEAYLATFRDVTPGAQTLWFMERVPGRNSIGGAGAPLTNGAIAAGLVGVSSNGYLGLAHPGVTRVTADGRGYHRSAPVVRRFYALRPPRGTGAIVLRERAADGRVVSRRTLRR